MVGQRQGTLKVGLTLKTHVAKGGAEMVEKPKLTGVPLVLCEVCEKEIPKSVALGAENQDRVLYFCGSDCYQEWLADQIRERTQEAGEP